MRRASFDVGRSGTLEIITNYWPGKFKGTSKTPSIAVLAHTLIGKPVFIKVLIKRLSYRKNMVW